MCFIVALNSEIVFFLKTEIHAYMDMHISLFMVAWPKVLKIGPIQPTIQ